ncbi:MAG TPA: SDR family oxidoreductase [Myxococcota bacterium]|nr:SDR family oxidoreductase [Myxococcales bacterium]HPG25597.1 SDR family oxidoreductase [Myxococcota bacterium]
MGMHEGRVALVTGAGSGIGRASAILFAQEGAKVAVVDRNEAGAKETARAIEAAGGEAIALAVDVTDEAAVAGMIAETVARFGRLDAAMNNAGITSPPFLFHEMPLDEWHRMIGVNLTAVFLCMKHEIAQMLTQSPLGAGRGAIVNTSSGAAIVPAPGQPHYTAAKHGVVGLMKNVAQEYVKQGIRCNSILPGITDTPMVMESIERGGPGRRELLESTAAGGVLSTPEEMAEAAVWLCSDRARRVNGQGLVVDGGGVLR